MFRNGTLSEVKEIVDPTLDGHTRPRKQPEAVEVAGLRSLLEASSSVFVCGVVGVHDNLQHECVRHDGVYIDTNV